MTNFGTILLLLVCVGIGYVVEPVIFSGISEFLEKKEDTGTAAAGASVAVKPQPPALDGASGHPPAPSIKVDLTKVAPEDFPEKVVIKVPLTISDAASGVTMELPKGTKVKPIRIQGSDLVIQPVGFPVESTVNVDQTNFKELAVPKMLERLRNTPAEPTPTPPAPPAVSPAPEVTPEPAPPATSPDPEPEPDPATPSTVRLDGAAIVALLKKDVQAGNVSEFKVSQVISWKAGDDMEFDGDTYQTGHVTFKAETVLGVQEHEAIALIEQGKVYKWIWAKTKLDMR